MEQDVQGLDHPRMAMVAVEADPLWRAVIRHSCRTQAELIRWMLLHLRPPQASLGMWDCTSGTRHTHCLLTST